MNITFIKPWYREQLYAEVEVNSGGCNIGRPTIRPRPGYQLQGIRNSPRRSRGLERVKST